MIIMKNILFRKSFCLNWMVESRPQLYDSGIIKSLDDSQRQVMKDRNADSQSESSQICRT